MRKVLHLYRELTTVSRVNELGEHSVRFSVTLNREYASILEELTQRTGIARAEMARLLLCTSLDEIDSAYNLRNSEEFDYSKTHSIEEELDQEEVYSILEEHDRISNSINTLQMLKNNFVPGDEDSKKQLGLLESELEKYVQQLEEFKKENNWR